MTRRLAWYAAFVLGVLAAPLLAVRSADVKPAAPRAADAPLLRGEVSILDFGADPSGQVDTAPGLSAALGAVGSFGVVVVPAGTYVCQSGITTLGATGLTLRGVGVGSHLAFRGTSSDGLRFEDCNFLTVRDLHVSGPPTVARGLHVTLSDPVGSSEHAHVENVFAEGFRYAFAVGADTHGDVSEINFYSCVGVASADAAFVLGDNVPGNVLDVRFYGCRASNGKVGVLARGCGFSWHGGTTLGNREADFRQLGASSSPVLIQGVRSEHSRRLWDYPSTQTYGVTVTIESVFAAAFTDSAGIAVNHFGASPLTLIGCTFGGGPRPARIALGFAKEYPLPVVAINVVTDNDDPFGPADPRRDLTMLGCHKLAPGSWATRAGKTMPVAR